MHFSFKAPVGAQMMVFWPWTAAAVSSFWYSLSLRSPDRSGFPVQRSKVTSGQTQALSGDVMVLMLGCVPVKPPGSSATLVLLLLLISMSSVSASSLNSKHTVVIMASGSASHSLAFAAAAPPSAGRTSRSGDRMNSSSHHHWNTCEDYNRMTVMMLGIRRMDRQTDRWSVTCLQHVSSLV